MQVSKLTLQNFRNYKKRQFEFSPETTFIIGPNAIGKTNILESVYLLSTGKSFHARREEEMVGYDAEIARVSASVLSSKENVVSDKNKTHATGYIPPATKLEVVLTRGMIDISKERSEKVPRKKLLVNGISRHMYTFAGNLKSVLFGPWDMDLVTESPSVRRRFLNVVLSQVDKEYRRSILSYDKGLRQRNKILLKIREEGFSRNALMFWDQLLIKSGNYITEARQEFLNFANDFPDPQGQDFSVEYDRSVISEGRLAQYKDEEVAAATTLVGPHRDDFLFKIKKDAKKERDLAKFGSRGEQRMGVLWLKLAELSFIEKKTEDKPVLLLDDIFSELDHANRDVVMKICQNQQTIITTADEHFILGFKNRNTISLLEK